jgi:hypothetical protein
MVGPMDFPELLKRFVSPHISPFVCHSNLDSITDHKTTRFQILTAVTMEIIFWGVTPCILVEIYWRFGGKKILFLSDWHETPLNILLVKPVRPSYLGIYLNSIEPTIQTWRAYYPIKQEHQWKYSLYSCKSFNDDKYSKKKKHDGLLVIFRKFWVLTALNILGCEVM